MESNPYRANLAKELGANHVVNPEDVDAVEQVYALTNGKGARVPIRRSIVLVSAQPPSFASEP